jgi:hypothetical protein
LTRAARNHFSLSSFNNNSDAILLTSFRPSTANAEVSLISLHVRLLRRFVLQQTNR